MAFDEDDDLSLVPLHKREDVRRRIAAVKRYIADPRRAVLDREAQALGLSIHSVKKLAQAWRLLARPEALAGAGSPRKRRDQLSAAQHGVLASAVAEGGDAELPVIMERVHTTAASRGVDMPGQDSIRANLRRLIARRLPTGSFAIGADFILEHCAVDLPVANEAGGVTMPIAAVLIEIATATIRGVALSMDGPSACAAARAASNALSLGLDLTDGKVLALAVYQGDAWLDLVSALSGIPILVRTEPRTRIGRVNLAVALLGDRHEGVWLRPRLTGRPRDKRPATLPTGGMGLDIQAAEEFVNKRWVESLAASPEIRAANADALDRLRLLGTGFA